MPRLRVLRAIAGAREGSDGPIRGQTATWLLRAHRQSWVEPPIRGKKFGSRVIVRLAVGDVEFESAPMVLQPHSH